MITGLHRAVLLPDDIRALAAARPPRSPHRSLPPHHPSRARTAAFNSLLADLHRRGVPISELAAALDPPLSHQSVRERISAAPAPPAPLAPPAITGRTRAQFDPQSSALLRDAGDRSRRVLVFPAPSLSDIAPSAPLITELSQLLHWLSTSPRAPRDVLVPIPLAEIALIPLKGPLDDN